ncbi:GIY-YIG nuclease family protein [Brevundimonas diminuta]|uniref:GIY-YIG nuclease family protein n=1 Tax=Brevundimonas diminuta TaxID=293 RepID=UPI0030F5226A
MSGKLSWVYFLLEENDADWRIKIGRTNNIPTRRRALQTGNSRPLMLLGWIRTRDGPAAEAALHMKYAECNIGGAAKEWFFLQPADIALDLMRAGIDGFVAKNADAFEIVGCDKDAVPEYLGVWKWADFELEECCPFCGCLCGLQFQEASQMYHCRDCDALADFEEDLMA